VGEKIIAPNICYICHRDMQGKEKFAVMLPSLDCCPLRVPKVERTDNVCVETELVIYRLVHKISEFPRFVHRERCICERCLLAASIEEVFHFYEGKVPKHSSEVFSSEGKGSLGIGEGVSIEDKYLKDIENILKEEEE